MRTKFKAWAEPYLKEHPEISLSDDQINNLDGFSLEIGSGKGQFLIDMHQKFPQTLFVGIEKNVTCAGITAKKIVEAQTDNVKLLFNDFINVVPNIKDKSVNNIYLNFSDPWPKKRHHKRRLTAPKFLDEYYRILKDDGLLIFKTDNIELFSDSIKTFSESKLKIKQINNDYDGLDENDAMTEYETSFRNKGNKIFRMVVTKK